MDIILGVITAVEERAAAVILGGRRGGGVDLLEAGRGAEGAAVILMEGKVVQVQEGASPVDLCRPGVRIGRIWHNKLLW